MGTLHNDDVGELHIGTSSWTFPDWRGVFYPSGLPAQEQLNYYATQFNSVEVNTSFYALPAPGTLLQWVESAPEGFTFAVKAPRAITHEKRLVDVRTESRAYLDVLRSLGPTAAPGFLQFPPSFTRARGGRLLARYLEWLAGERDGLLLSVEVRAEDLMTPAFARYLAERGMGLVVVERTGQADVYDAWQAALETPGAPRVLHVRLIGNDREPLPDDKQIRRPQDDRLDKWAERIAAALRDGIHVYCYIQNPFEGHAPATVRRLWARIHARHPLPAWAPEMVRPAQENGGQLSLFGDE